MSKEPIIFIGRIKRLAKKITQSNNIDVILTIEVSDYPEIKAMVIKELADMEAEECFDIVIKEQEGING